MGRSCVIAVKHLGKFGVTRNHLIEWVHFEDIEGDEGSDKGRNAPLVDNCLLGAHIVESCQVDYIADFQMADEWIY